MEKKIDIKLSSDKLKLNVLAMNLCDDCLSMLISTSAKNMPEGLTYFIVTTSLCEECYDKLLEKELIEQMIFKLTVGNCGSISRVPLSLWTRTTELMGEINT